MWSHAQLPVTTPAPWIPRYLRWPIVLFPVRRATKTSASSVWTARTAARGTGATTTGACPTCRCPVTAAARVPNVPAACTAAGDASVCSASPLSTAAAISTATPTACASYGRIWAGIVTSASSASGRGAARTTDVLSVAGIRTARRRESDARGCGACPSWSTVSIAIGLQIACLERATGASVTSENRMGSDLLRR